MAFQEQNLNRGEWRLLEEQERVWDDEQNLTITVTLTWEDGYQILPTGGHVPSHMIKHIYFEEDETCRKFVFPNEKPITRVGKNMKYHVKITKHHDKKLF